MVIHFRKEVVDGLYQIIQQNLFFFFLNILENLI